MRTVSRVLLTNSLLLGGFLALVGTLTADRAARPARAREGPGTTTPAEGPGEVRGTPPWDVSRAVARSELRVGDLTPLDRDRWVLPPPGGLRVVLQVLVDGRPLPTVRHAGKTYLPVPRWGTEYTIRVSNHGPRRVAAIVSVDGLSVINGRPASEDSPGYLVAPYSQIVIKGWRRNLDTVAAFSFEERGRSYASRVGRPEDIGVIGLLAIEERVLRPRPVLELKGRERPPASRASGGVGDTGTGYGRDVDSPVYYVPFDRGANRRTITLYYDTVDALRRAGIPVGPSPVPFPGDTEFVPPPPGDRGK